MSGPKELMSNNGHARVRGGHPKDFETVLLSRRKDEAKGLRSYKSKGKSFVRGK